MHAASGASAGAGVGAFLRVDGRRGWGWVQVLLEVLVTVRARICKIEGRVRTCEIEGRVQGRISLGRRCFWWGGGGLAQVLFEVLATCNGAGAYLAD